jgi:uncharacterized membrane protein
MLFDSILLLHVAAGFIALFIGTWILFARKGKSLHKKLGSIFFWSMLTASLCALAMAFIHTNQFLFIIGIFTCYMLITGKRYLLLRNSKLVTKADWTLLFIMIVFGIFLIAIGTHSVISENYFGFVPITFAIISFLFVIQDSQYFRGRKTGSNLWITTHLQRMLGSYIASFTAFLVVNNNWLPPIIAWLLPTICIVPLLLHWSKRYTNKISSNP